MERLTLILRTPNSYFEILENKEVAVEEVKEYKSTPKGYDKDGNKIQYRLKTGSFKSMEGADRQKAQNAACKAYQGDGFQSSGELGHHNGAYLNRCYPDFDALWQTFPDEVKAIGQIWRDTGLLDEDGNERPAFTVWQAHFNR